MPESDVVAPKAALLSRPEPAVAPPPAGDRPECPAAPQVAILTGGGDKPYALGLATTLLSLGMVFDFIGSDSVQLPKSQLSVAVRFFNLRGNQRTDASRSRKILRVIVFYIRLLRYAATARPKIFHILWNNKLEFLDRTLLLAFYRLRGKRLVFTAHNINAARRDGNDGVLNRFTLRIQYRLLHHVFVHTKQMKEELQAEFGLRADKISVIPFGLNSTVPTTDLTSAEARQSLGLSPTNKVILFFGHIAPYKGLEYLIAAFSLLLSSDPTYRLLIGGRPKGCEEYMKALREQIEESDLNSQITARIGFVPDEDTEMFFKAADVIVLPYTHIFQSGVMFLAYNFGLPVIASDVGSMSEDIVEGETGYIFKPRDPIDLVRALRTYFDSALFFSLPDNRQRIREVALEKYSWSKVGKITQSIYERLLPVQSAGPVKPSATR